MMDWSLLGRILDFCGVYFTIQLVRCAFFSFLLMGLVMLLRKLFFSKGTFFRGMLWALFLIIPFLGKLKVFYENEAVVRATWWITAGTMSCLWIDRIYIAGILGAFICIFGKRLRLLRTVAGMETAVFENVRVCVTDMNVTPFTVGLFRPKIVLPKVMAEGYGMDELKSVIQHEQTHIRLGHLWCGFAWDILRCLLWVNPFLTICQKDFREDMEDICDRVCIQNSGKTAQDYGMVLVKSLKLLRYGNEDIPPAATYVGEKDFADMKRRMGKIADFRPYQARLCIGMAVIMGAFLCMVLALVHNCSYARCNQDKDMLVYEYDGRGVILPDYDNKLPRMITFDDSYVYVEREAFENFLQERGATEEIYIVFGGFYKLPGIAGISYSCCYEYGSKDKVVKIPYDNGIDDWWVKLVQIL